MQKMTIDRAAPARDHSMPRLPANVPHSLHYFFIEDRLDFGDDYFAMNVPQGITITAQGKSSKETYYFTEMPCTSGTGNDSIDYQTYQIIRESEEVRSDQGKEDRAFRIYFNTAKRGSMLW